MKQFFFTSIIASTLFLFSCQTGPLNADVTVVPDTEDVVEDIVSDLETKKTYYWKVVADDGNGNVVESDTWTFETE